MSICGGCIHDDVCGVEDNHEEALVSCAYRIPSIEREKIAKDVADKMAYMNTCLNERNIILGIIRGKRETLESLCSDCKSESCVTNGTAISKTDYEARLKADIADVFEKLREEIDRQQKWLLQAGYTAYNVDIALDAIKAAVAEMQKGARNDHIC